MTPWIYGDAPLIDGLLGEKKNSGQRFSKISEPCKIDWIWGGGGGGGGGGIYGDAPLIDGVSG